MKKSKKIIKLLASLKLAVFVLVAMAAIIAIGTIIESKYNAATAKAWVYDSPWMYIINILLAINLIAVMMDRWPWKKHHSAFVFAHIGIIILQIGSVLTMQWGLDGSLRLEPNNPESKVTTQETQLTLFKSKDGADYNEVFAEKVDFLKSAIKPEKPFAIKAKDLDIQIQESVNYALPKMKVEESPQSQSGAGVRFQISNGNMNQIDWMVQRNVFEKIDNQLGLIYLTLGGLWERNLNSHEIRMMPDQAGFLKVDFYQKGESKPYISKKMTEGDVVQTKWMGLEFRVLRFLNKAQKIWEVEKKDFPTPMTVSALKIKYNNNESWLFLNDYLKIFTQDRVYILAYHNQKVDLGLPITLKEFKKSSYPGTMRAMAYESVVEYDKDKTTTISMNEPLKFNGYYFYQASFEESAPGKVAASILSVNRDPGRSLKYLGSLIMCLGIIMLFYFKKKGFYGKKPDQE